MLVNSSLHWGLSPGPSVYKTDALPLSYRGCAAWRLMSDIGRHPRRLMRGIGCHPGRVFGMLGRRQGGVAAGLPPGVGCHDGFDFNWPRGVTVSTLDSESSDRGSNPREASVWQHMCPCARGPLVCAGSNDPDRSLASRGGPARGARARLTYKRACAWRFQVEGAPGLTCSLWSRAPMYAALMGWIPTGLVV